MANGVDATFSHKVAPKGQHCGETPPLCSILWPAACEDVASEVADPSICFSKQVQITYTNLPDSQGRTLLDGELTGGLEATEEMEDCFQQTPQDNVIQYVRLKHASSWNNQLSQHYWSILHKKLNPKYVQTLDAVMKYNDIVHQEDLKVWEMDMAQPSCTQVNYGEQRSVKQLNCGIKSWYDGFMHLNV